MAYAQLDSPYLSATTYGAGGRKKAANPSLAAFANLAIDPYSPGAHRGEGEERGPLPSGVTQAQVDASLAANPNASRGGYMGPPMGAQYTVPGDQAGAKDPNLDTGTADTSIDSDPALVQIRAANTRDLGQAQAAALEGRRKALQDFGDPLLAASLLGQNDPTLASISSDPDKSTSILARLARTYRDRTKQNDEQLNQDNLFYSGYRGNVLKGIAQDQATDTADATSNVHTALGQIGAALLAAENGAADAEAKGIVDAGARHQNDPTGGASTDGGGADAAGADTSGGVPLSAGFYGLGPGGFNTDVPAPPVGPPAASPTTPPPPANLPLDAMLASYLGQIRRPGVQL